VTLLTTVRPASNQIGSTLVNENCDSTTIGNIPTGWTVESGTSWQVVTAPAGLSGRSLLATTDASFDHYLVKTFTRQTDGLVSIGWRVLTNSVLTGRSGVMTVYDTAGGYVAQVGPLNGVWVYGNTSGVSGSVGSWAANTVYDVVVHVDMDQKKFKFQVGATYYDNAGAWWPLTTGTTGIDRIKYSLYSPAGGSFYIDDVQVGQIEPTNPPPTTTGTLTTSGTFDGHVLGADRFGRIVLGYENADSQAASIRMERSNDNTNWFDLGGQQQQTISTGSGRWVVIDRRPHYGTEAGTYGGTVYYRVGAFNSGGNSPTSASGAMTADINVSSYETTRFAALSTIMNGAAVPSTAAGEAYPTYWLGAMTYAYVKTGNAQYLADIQTQWDYIKTLTGAGHGCVQLADYTDFIYRDHHWRTILWAAACSRLLRYEGQTTLADDMVAQCDTWVANFAALASGTPRVSKTLQGFDANDDSVSNNQRVWQASTAYAVGAIVTPTSRNGRTYRVTVAGTSSGTQPTWPTTNGGSVSLNGVTYVETTASGAVTYATYDATAPYAGSAGEDLADLNQNGEEAAALALLVTDPASSLFTAGAARTAALTVITDVTALMSTFATSTGAIPIGSTFPAVDGPEGYDTLYGAYTLEVGALIARYAQFQTHAYLDDMLVKGLTWLSTSYGTEPLTAMHYTGFTGVYSTELLMREYPYRLFGVSNPVQKIRYTHATNHATSELPSAEYSAVGVTTPDVEDHAARSFTSDQFLQLLVGRAASSLTDGFATLNTAEWSPYGTIAPTIDAGRLKLTTAAADTVYAGVNNIGRESLDLTGSTIYVKVSQTPMTGSHETYFEFVKTGDPTNKLMFYIAGASFAARLTTNGSNNDTSVTYNATDHAYWRFRESGGTVYWDTSPDASTWTNQKSAATPAWVANGAYVNLTAGHWQAQPEAVTTYFDNLNVAGATNDLAGTIAGVSTASGSLTVRAALAATIAGQGTTTGTLTSRAVLSGTVAATSTITGTMAVSKPLAGTVAASSTVTGSLTVRTPLAGAVAAASSVTGALTATAAAAGTIAAVSTVTGTLTIGSPLTGAVAASSTVTGTLLVSKPIAGAVTASSTVTGSLTNTEPGDIALAGTVASTSTVSGALAVGAPLATTVAAQSTVTGALTVEAAGQNPLRGTVASSSTISGTLHITRELAGAVAAQSSVTGALTATGSLTGAVAASSTVTGALVVSHLLAGTVTATSTVAGATIVLRPLAGQVAATSSVSASLTNVGPVTSVGALEAGVTVMFGESISRMSIPIESADGVSESNESTSGVLALIE
jgi:hypothetical protein